MNNKLYTRIWTNTHFKLVSILCVKSTHNKVAVPKMMGITIWKHTVKLLHKVAASI